MTLFERILARKDAVTAQIRELDARIALSPEGSLKCNKSGSRYKYYQEISDRSRGEKTEYVYLPKKDIAKIQALARKAVWRRQRRELICELRALDAYLKVYKTEEDKKYQRILNCAPLYDVLRPETEWKSDIIRAWEDEEYETNPGFPENLIVPATGGLMVRSKSEAFIAHELKRRNIPFRYECALELNGMIHYPDYTVLQPEHLVILIWEHFGMMDVEEYRQSAARKIKTYIENGYTPGKDLIMTFESKDHPMDIQQIIDVIENQIL
ncbi:MAG: hypothetical protein IJJ25_13190 [Lachnospiraceae bacterium]|nr:hypothetical protein [Lachnospiraceae bacterium]